MKRSSMSSKVSYLSGSQSSLLVQNNRSSPPENRTATPFKEAKSDVTLSALLNFIDGLWSNCGDERIIVFTTNHKDRLDPALLRPGRMDVHINMSYCTFSAFKVLASSYLGIEDHAFYAEIETMLGSFQATPAEIAGELMKGTDADYALKQTDNFESSEMG
ncbi:ATPase, AAA-type, core [Dillenia turbinata]|uniref:ATPase, AAA-type, core n=1 Tax=Dillenia turbinata TaxID=194707 RepID=A0AAN8W129_9MAGN